ncbi:hypothetical protein EDD22DRAFT_849097 [Suillus occidentalis]|nr:hypothetical protein EDD22DRAFT_849097 [Suillus occidentalis]
MLQNECPACSESDASMVMQLKHEISQLQHAVTHLQADRAMLVSENTTLSTKCETLQNVIINIRGSTSSVTSNSSETSNHTKDEQKPCLLDTTMDEECDRELDPKDYPHLKSWTKQQWQEDCPKNLSAVPGSAAKSSRGSARMAQGINVSYNYSQWYNYHVKKRGTKHIKSEDTGGELHESSVDTLPSTSTSASDPESSSDYLNPMIDPLLQEPPTKKQRLEDAENTTSEVLLQLEIPLPPAEINEPALPSLSLENEKQTETLNVEVKNLLAGFVLKPAVTTPPAPTPFSSGASSTNIIPSGPSRMLPSVADVASLAVKMELVATENTIAKAANTIANTQPVKKWQPSLKPINICTLNWQKMVTSESQQVHLHSTGTTYLLASRSALLGVQEKDNCTSSFFFNTAGRRRGGCNQH